MKNKTVILSILLVLAFLLSACGTTTTIAPTAQPAQTAQRTLTVSGTGKVTLKPDMATINVGVHTENIQAAQAVADNNTSTQKLIDAIKAAGVDANDIQTTNFSIYQNNTTSPDGKTTLANYAVDNTVYLTVRKLDQLGSLLDAAVKAGANNVNSIQFDLSDKTKALSQARGDAVKTARTQAEELASAAGVTLGDIQSIEYSDGTPITMLTGKGMGGGAASFNAAMPINPGQMDITVNVTIAYAIK